jgi:hypothetical protein
MRLFHVLLLLCLALVRGEAARAADDSLAEKGQPPHIALLLPLNEPALKAPAQAVRDGFLAAAKGEGIPVRIEATGAEVAQILTAYEAAVANGARVVVGPLTRNAVTALAKSGRVSVPTLTLSLPERELLLPPNLVGFGLSAEEEARQVATLAFADGHRHALVVVADTALARRIQAAFAEQWLALGGRLAASVRFTPGREAAVKGVAAGGADMVFLAAGAGEARAVRPYLAATLPVYATSQAFGGRLSDPRNVDLAGVRFVDIPWLLEPDHPAVMILPRPQSLPVELERLYALGIDAARLAAIFWRQGVGEVELDGVTGRLTLGAEGIVSRRAVAAEFVQDTVVVVEPAPGARP